MTLVSQNEQQVPKEFFNTLASGNKSAPTGKERLKLFGLLLRALFIPSKNEQKPDKSYGQSLNEYMDKKASVGKITPGLFTAMDAPLHGLTPDDVQYADEVEAALARRPRLGVRLLTFAVVLFFVFLIGWAAIADIDEVTHADGQVIASQRTQTIQNLEGGIIRGIEVHEGQIVEKGTLLARLDNEQAEASFRDAMSKAIENYLSLIRLEAELKHERPVFPANLQAALVKNLGREIDSTTLARARQILRDQELAWESRSKMFDADLEVLNTQYLQRKHEIDEQTAYKAQLEQTAKLAKEQRNTAAELMQRRNFARMEFLGLEQKVAELDGQINRLEATIPKAQAAKEEAWQRMQSKKAENQAAITQEIARRRVELTSLRETISAGGDRVTRTELRSPVRGTVKRIYITTVGGVAKPGDPILDIVPLDDTLLVEARVAPKDVAFLRPGQNVMVKVTAYDFSIYGGMEGKLESISADTIEDKRGDLHYLAKVRTNTGTIHHNNDILPIIPGMMVTADIMIGKKTVLDYLLKPILKAKQNALREK